MVRKLSFLLAPCLALALSSCGSATEFGGGNAKNSDATKTEAKEPPGSEDPAVLDEPYTNLTWFWQCDAQPVEAPKAQSDQEVVVEGQGPHQFPPEKLAGTKVTLAGHLCPPTQVPRDIVFVIDTSGSMIDNDPRVGDTCGRLNAVKSAIASVPKGAAKFGLATFNSDLDRSSTAMFDDEASLFADVSAGGNIADVLCNQSGGTNYDAGLTRAQALLQGGRANAAKEVYLVSDGQPTLGQDGIGLATTLKTSGILIGGNSVKVSIATIMLAGFDTVLENFIASRDSNGKPLHAFAAQTGELTKILTQLADNALVRGELRYRPIGGKNWQTLNLMDYLKDGFNFSLPSFTIDMNDAPMGIEMSYEYFDKRDNMYSGGGKLVWVKESAALSE